MTARDTHPQTGRGPNPARLNRHKCRVPGCTQMVRPDRLMCRPHWHQVPRPLQEIIWATWRSGAGVFDPEYRAAVRDAVAAVQAQESPAVEQARKDCQP